ncbi:hypothetical protein ABN611_38515 [Kribbella sp. HUAS MG21]|uniref:Uncharacterized protein n=1 Tax=Kribbella sp. HUAS MG21 TaxID=3160966 RepID=A0AAU7TC85_9ACTN
MEGGVGEDGAAVGVEHDVLGGDRAVGEAGVVEVGYGFGHGGQEGDEFAAGQGAAAGEEGCEGAGDEVLGDEDPAGAGLVELS